MIAVGTTNNIHIIYCNIARMNSYNGMVNDSMRGGGSYIKNNIGHEVNNFTNHDGTYYGFVQSTSNTIDISKNFGVPKDCDFIDGVLVVWVAEHKIVGFYNNARVFKKIQHMDPCLLKDRIYDDYNTISNDAYLIPVEERNFNMVKSWRCGVWYAHDQDKLNADVLKYIESFEKNQKMEEEKISDFNRPLEGYEKKAVIKIRVNQYQFRDKMLKRWHNKCSLCGVSLEGVLIASHIKPWSESDGNEKMSEFNGLLLCPSHDLLFDKGYISFESDGRIILSDALPITDRSLMNVNENMKINVTTDNEPFLKYHRERKFIT